MCLQIGNCQSLPLIQSKLRHDHIRQPIPPEGHDEEASTLFELWFRQTGVLAKINHGLGTGANPLDVTRQVESATSGLYGTEG